MPTVSFVIRLLIVVFLSATLSACDTAEERAQGHYDRALSLVEKGEIEKAILEYKNVFKLDGTLIAARLDYAKLMLETGNIREAVAHFNLVIEQDAENLEARRLLTRMMFNASRWDDVARNLEIALELAPDDPEFLGYKASLEYRKEDTREEALALARRVIEADPAQLAARGVIIASYTDAENNEQALVEIDTALTYDPDELQLYLLRLVILERLGDDAVVGTQLEKMAQRFPANVEIAQALVRWHMARNDIDAAENTMRDLAATSPDDAGLSMMVVAFIEQVRGLDAARDELERLAEESSNASVFRRALALLDYQLGNTDAAFKAADALLAEATSDRDIADAKVLIAQLRFETGDLDAALPLVNEVLELDDTNVDALVVRAQIAIANEIPENAIQDLRTALNHNPGNPRIHSLLAQAHIRNGSTDLARDRLAQAVEYSGVAPSESMAYANFLVSEENLAIAEDVLVASLLRQPNNIQLLQALADLRQRRQDWDGALEIAAKLREIDPTEQNLNAESIEVATLSGQKRFDESIARIEGVLEKTPDNRALATLMDLYMKSGQAEKAESTLREVLANDSSNVTASMLLGSVLNAENRSDEAEAIYRGLIESNPEIPQPYVLLYTLLSASERLDEAGEVLDSGAVATNGDATVQLVRAAYREITGDIETAIGIYEELYSKDPNSLIVANNLASLMSEYRTDAESQDRALRVARRFRNSDVPAFQDTYGWILFKRGNFSRALVPLQSAYDGLPGNPLVAFHYGMTLAELGQKEEAIRILEQAIELAGDGTTLPQMSEARAKIEVLKAPVAE